MKKKNSNKFKSVLFIVIILIITAGIIYFVFLPRENKIKDLDNSLDKADKTLKNNLLIFNKINENKANRLTALEAEKSLLEVYYQDVNQDTYLNDCLVLLGTLKTSSIRSNTSEFIFVPGNDSEGKNPYDVYSNKNFTTEIGKNPTLPAFYYLTLNLEVSGTTDELNAFLEKIYANPSKYSITSLSANYTKETVGTETKEMVAASVAVRFLRLGYIIYDAETVDLYKDTKMPVIPSKYITGDYRKIDWLNLITDLFN